MSYFTSLVTITIGLILICFICPRPAHAYLDPGTGSYVLQLLIAGLLGAAFAVKVFWNDIKTFFRNLLSRKGEDEEAKE